MTSGTFAAFSAKTSSANNQVSAASDWTGPSIGAVVATKGSGTDGYVRPGGTYTVYANVPSDSGSPPSGVKSATADVSSLTPGTSAAAMTSGTYTWSGTSYTHKSGTLTVSSTTPEGAATIGITATDNAGNQTVKSGIPVTVDATAPATTDIQTANKTGGTTGLAENGDTITYTFSEHVEPSTILSGWSGSSTAVTVRLINGASGDSIAVYDSANTTQLKLGTVVLPGTGYVASNVNIPSSSMVMSSSSPWTVTITLGTPSGTVSKDLTKGAMSWTPLTGITDLAGNALPTTTRTETGVKDAEF